ncbi:MAG TPA: Omp28-related outer membrane protein [Chitinophagales bacterium]|nr:Omp28-related outer membrane protein [Chitinophagales bacterium]
MAESKTKQTGASVDNMRILVLCAALTAMSALFAAAQTGRVVLIEEFAETGCSACAQYDSAFQAITDAHADKVAVINFHCHYKSDPFYTFNKACDKRYAYYGLSGFPCAMMNGRNPAPASSHISFVTPARINALYSQEPQFEFDIQSKTTGSGNTRTARIEVAATSLKDNPSKDLALFIVVTENNIIYEERYGSKSVNGINRFNHIMRAMLPDEEGTPIGAQTKGKMNNVEVTFANDEKEINYTEVRIVAFVQDKTTKEVLGAAVTKEHPFK